MHASLEINMEIVAKYLVMATSTIKGVTVNDICMATGLSKSTVYRVINKHPGIKPFKMPGKQKLYWYDSSVLYEQAKNSTARKLEVDAAHENYFAGLNPIQVMLKMQQYIKPDADGNSVLRTNMKPIGEFASEAIQFQQGQGDAPSPEEFRAAVEEALLFSAMLQITMTSIKANKAYTSNECWSMFTVEDYEKETS